MASFPDSAARIQFLADGSLHPFVLRLNPGNTISNVSVIDGAGIQGTWDPDLESVTFTLPVDGGVREYSGYLMRFLSDGSAALADVARVTWDDGSHDDNTGWYAVEDLPHLRLKPPNQTDPPAHLMGGGE